MQYQRLMAIGLGGLLLSTIVVSLISVIQSNETIGVLKDISERQEPVREQFDKLEQLINDANLRFLQFSRSKPVSAGDLVIVFTNLNQHMTRLFENGDAWRTDAKQYAAAREHVDRALVPPADLAAGRTDSAAIDTGVQDFFFTTREILSRIANIPRASAVASEIQLAAIALDDAETLYQEFVGQSDGPLVGIVVPLNNAMAIIETLKTDAPSLLGLRRDGRLEAMQNAIGQFKAAVVLFDDEQRLEVTGENLAEIMDLAYSGLQKSQQELHALKQVVQARVVAMQIEQRGAWENRRTAFFFVIALAVICAATMAYLLHSVLSRRISSLVEATREVAQGNLTYQIAKGPEDQIGEVSDAINLMARMLKERDDSQRSVEEELRQAQKLEAVGQLTGGVAHDFNNLLAVVQGNAELLKDKVHTKDLPLAAAIIRAAERGGELTQRLLAYARNQPLHSAPIDLGDLVHNMGGLLARTLGGMVEIKIIAGPDLWPAMADRGQVENAILNLAINARDAMPRGGTLTIECMNVTVNADTVMLSPKIDVDDYAVLSVSDTGVGMSDAVRARIFEPFFTTKDVGAGSGLGLSMIYGFVKQSGGYITVDSAEGQGTTFKVFLPRAWEAAERTNVVGDEDSPRGQQEVVLVVEDSIDVQTMVAAMLEGLGYRVVVASTAIEARSALAHEKRVDVILSDIVLPGGVSGLEFAEEVRARNPGVKVVFMSGYSADAARSIGNLSPDDIFLNKPFTRDQLAAALRTALH